MPKRLKGAKMPKRQKGRQGPRGRKTERDQKVGVKV